MHTISRSGLVLITLFSCFAGNASGQSESAPPQPKEAAVEIDKLIRQLGHDEFELREAASAKLRKYGPAAEEALKRAVQSDDREIAGRAKALLGELVKEHENRGVVHVVGLYESRNQPAVVEITDTTRPIILVVCAYERVNWQIRAAKGVDLVRVIASGYHAQTVEGTDAPTVTFSYDQMSRGPDGGLFYFYTYDHDEEKYPSMVAKVESLTGKKPKWFQGRYGFKRVPFVIAAPE